MSEAENLPRFPDITPDSVKKTTFWVFENSDFTSQADVDVLIEQLFHHPEDSFYLYSEQREPINAFVNSAAQCGVIRIIESQGFYYRHPNCVRDYLRIREPAWEWEREVADRGPMFFRHELKLAARTTRDLEQRQLLRRQKVEREAERISARPENPLKLEPNFMGIGLDLRKAWRWLKQWSRQR